MGKHLSHSKWVKRSFALLDEHAEVLKVYPTQRDMCKDLGINVCTFSKYFKQDGEYLIEKDGQQLTVVEYNSTGVAIHLLYDVDEEPAVFNTSGAAIKFLGCSPATFYSRRRKFVSGEISYGEYDLANPITSKNEFAGQPIFVKLVKLEALAEA